MNGRPPDEPRAAAADWARSPPPPLRSQSPAAMDWPGPRPAILTLTQTRRPGYSSPGPTAVLLPKRPGPAASTAAAPPNGLVPNNLPGTASPLPPPGYSGAVACCNGAHQDGAVGRSRAADTLEAPRALSSPPPLGTASASATTVVTEGQLRQLAAPRHLEDFASWPKADVTRWLDAINVDEPVLRACRLC